MTNDDDFLGRALRAAAPTPSHSGVHERIVRRRRRREFRARAGSAFLAVAVLGASAGAFTGLRTAFRPADGPSGVIAYSKTLRACSGHPNVGGPQVDVFATTPDGSRGWNLTEDARFSRRRLRNEEQVTFSPDGRRFAWVDHYLGGLYVTDVATSATDRLLDGSSSSVSSPAWSPDGATIVFTGGPATPLLQRGADPWEPEIRSIPAMGGEPVRLVPRGVAPAWSPDGGTIAFLRPPRMVTTEHADGTTETGPEPGATQSLWFMNADGSNLREIAVQPSDTDWNVIGGDWSPDGERFAAEVDFAGNHDIVVASVDAPTGIRLTDAPAADTSPTWSPDGSTIAFSTGRWGTGVGHSEIATVNADGGTVQRVTDDCWDDFDPVWVADDAAIASLPTWSPPPLPDLGAPQPAASDRILFANDVEGIVDLYAIDPDVGDPVNLTADLAEQDTPRWSPNRRWIAYTEYTDGQGRLVVRDAAGQDVRVVATEAGRSDWSPDGSRLVFESGSGLTIVDVVTGELTTLLETDRAFAPAWSPDGRSVAFGSATGLRSIDVETGRTMSLTREEGDGDPAWSPDGAWIAFGTGSRGLAAIRPDGSGLRAITQAPGDGYDDAPSWSPDGDRLVFTSTRVPEGGGRPGGLRLWTVAPDGSDLRPVPHGPRNVHPGADW